jgi:hypothetical protein
VLANDNIFFTSIIHLYNISLDAMDAFLAFSVLPITDSYD